MLHVYIKLINEQAAAQQASEGATEKPKLTKESNTAVKTSLASKDRAAVEAMANIKLEAGAAGKLVREVAKPVGVLPLRAPTHGPQLRSSLLVTGNIIEALDAGVRGLDVAIASDAVMVAWLSYAKELLTNEITQYEERKSPAHTLSLIHAHSLSHTHTLSHTRTLSLTHAHSLYCSPYISLFVLSLFRKIFDTFLDHDKSNHRGSDNAWINTIMKTGTVGDRLAAVVLRVQVCPTCFILLFIFHLLTPFHLLRNPRSIATAFCCR